MSEEIIEMNKTVFPIVYKYTQTGAVQQWQIIAEGDRFYTIEGQKGGKLTTSLPTICIGKNIGKKNETTPEQQAILQAAAKFEDKKKKGHYNEILTEEKNYREAMLAKDAKEVDIDYKKEVVHCQPKLDGLRSLGENDTMMSRNGKPYLAVPHLYQNKTVLDGELYNHQFKDDFNKIVSLCKKQKPTAVELEEAKQKVQYWIYDFPEHIGKFSERYQALRNWLVKNPNPSYVLVPTYRVRSEAEMKKRHEEFLAAGFEGTIIRRDLGPYEGKRSKQLLKYKDFTDEEFEITGAEEGTGGRAGTIGFFHMKMKNGKVFKSNVKGDFDYLKDLWKNHKAYIGKDATVKYFNLTPEKEDGTGGLPRFPYVIKLNRQEYE